MEDLKETNIPSGFKNQIQFPVVKGLGKIEMTTIKGLNKESKLIHIK